MAKVVTVVEFNMLNQAKALRLCEQNFVVESGKVVDNTFSADIKLTLVRVETRNYRFLYRRKWLSFHEYRNLRANFRK